MDSEQGKNLRTNDELRIKTTYGLFADTKNIECFFVSENKLTMYELRFIMRIPTTTNYGKRIKLHIWSKLFQKLYLRFEIREPSRYIQVSTPKAQIQKR